MSTPQTPDDAAHALDAAELVSERVYDALRGVWDPELAMDVVSLGLVYGVRVGAGQVGERTVEVDMTLTTPGCPVSEQLPAEAEQAVRAALPGTDVVVRVVWDPPWTPERIEPAASLQLRRR